MNGAVTLGFKSPLIASTLHQTYTDALVSRDRVLHDMSFMRGILTGLSVGGCDEENPVYREFKDLLDSLEETVDDLSGIGDFLGEITVLDDGETHEH